MKKTKHFNISVPELGDVPDITQVSNAISDLEDATAGTLEIMKAEMQGTKITLTSVSRKTKRTGYYEGMSIRFKSPQDIEPNYLKTISIDDLSDQVLSVAYKVNRNEYIDIVYEEDKFTAYPVVVQKTDSVSNNSSVLVGTAKGVKTAYDKGVEALNKANQAQSSANRAQDTADVKVNKAGDTMTGNLAINYPENPSLIMKHQNGLKAIFNYDTTYNHLTIHNATSKREIRLYDNGDINIDAKNLSTSSKEVISAINELNSSKENKIDKKSGFNLDKSDSVTIDSSKTLATSLAVKTAYDKGVDALNKANTAQTTADGKVSKSGDTMSGDLAISTAFQPTLRLFINGGYKGAVFAAETAVTMYNHTAKTSLQMFDNGNTTIDARNLSTSAKEVVGAINEELQLIKGNAGVDNIVYIQDSRQKFAGNGYLDRDTKKVYLCTTTTTSQTVDKNFMLSTNTELAKTSARFKEYYVLSTLNAEADVSSFKELLVYAYGSVDTIVGTYYLISSVQNINVVSYANSSLECSFSYKDNKIKLTSLGRQEDGYLRIFCR